METELKILFVEDEPTDVELAKRTLSQDGIHFQSRVVANETDFILELEKFSPDIIISDYRMPQFNGMRALKIALEKSPDIPFILFTGSVNEEIAVECIKTGAWDYIIIEHIIRLPFAVKEALQKKKTSIEKLKDEKGAEDSERKYRLLFMNNPVPMWIYDVKTLFFLEVNDFAVDHYGYSREEFLSMTIKDIRPPEDIAYLNEVLDKITGRLRKIGDVRHRRKDGSLIKVEITAHEIDFDGRSAMMVLAMDITERKRAEEALRESEKKFRTVVEEAVEIVFTVTNQGYFTYVNPAGLKSSGYSLDELKRLKYIDLIEPEWKQRVKRNYYRQYLERSVLSTTEYPFRTKSGEIKWFNQNARLIIENDEVKGFYVIARNVTECRKVEEALRESEERFRLLFDKAPLGYQSLDFDGNFIDVNQEWIDTLGYARQEVIGKWFGDFLAPKYKDAFRERFPIFKAQGKIHSEFEMVHKNGHYLFIAFDGRIGKDLEGNFKQTHCILKDITEQRHAEELLRESELRFKQVSESAHEWIWEVDSKGKYTYVSSIIKELLGYDAEELIGIKYFYDFFDPENKEEIKQAALGAFARKESFRNFINCIIHKDGRKIILSTTGIPILDKENNLIGYRGVDVDITERKQAEEDLIIKNKLNLLKAKIWEAVSNKSTDRADLINLMLEEAGNVLNISRATFLELDEEKKSFVTKHQWYRPEVGSSKKVLIPKKYVDLYIGQDYVQIPRQLNKIVRIFASPILKLYNIKSYLVVPFGNKSNPIGLFSFTDCIKERVWTDLEIDVLIDLSKILESFSIQREAEKMLSKSEERYRSVAQSANDAIITADSKGIILGWNKGAEKIFGYSEAEISGKELNIIIPKNYVEQHTKGMKRIEQGGKHHIMGNTVELHGLHKSCKEFPLELSLAEWKTSSGKFFTGIIRDITERKKSELALQKSHELLANLSDLVPGVVYQYRLFPDGRSCFPFASVGMNDIYEVTPEEVREDATPVFGRLHPDDYNRVAALIQESALTQQMFHCEFRVVLPRQGLRWRLSDARPELMDDGSTLWHGIISDITERKHAEETLLKLKKAVDNSGEVIFLTDKQGIFSFVNHAFTSLYGFTADEIIGKVTPRILKSGLLEENHYKQFWENILSGKEVIGELINKRKDGTLLYVDNSTTPILDEKKNIIGFLGIQRDISERKRAEEEIFSQKNRFAQLFENSPIAIALLDDQDKFVQINKSFSALFGYHLEEIKGQAINDLIVPPEFQEEAQTYSDEARSGNQINKESFRRRKDGSLVYIQIVAVPVIVNEKIVGIYGMYVDLTQRKKAEDEIIIAKEKAEEMSRLKSNFLANMSHELRTPLNGILGYADILTSQLDESGLNEMAQGIYRSGRRLSETLNLILDLTKVSSEKIDVFSKNTSLIPAVENVINLYEETAAGKNLLIEKVFAVENVYAKLDSNLFERTINNLVNNAVKFTSTGTITIETGKETTDGKDWAYVKVKDTGIGIPEDKIELIWEEFRQVSEGMSRSYEGAGLGLTISKRIIELMNGVITVESKFGFGSTFTVKFPAVEPASVIEEIKQVEEIKPKTCEAKKIDTTDLPLVLYVEDDFINQNVVKLYLNKLYRVETAKDGQFALQLVSAQKYDLILMDMNLGAGMDGMAVTKEIRTMPQYADTPIIAVTAYAMESDKKEFLSGGCTHFLSKPFQKREIVDLS